MRKRSLYLFLTSGILLTGLIPVGLYWFGVGRVPAVTVAEARQHLTENPDSVVIVDLRSTTRFQEDHLEGSFNLPLAELRTFKAASDLPSTLQGRELYLICQNGLTSAVATRRLRKMGILNTFNIKGGATEWRRAERRICLLDGTTRREERKLLPSGSFREMNLFGQWVAVLAAYVVKPLYMLLTLVVLFLLRKARDPDLLSLRWGLLFFFVGEAFCAVNFLAYGETSLLFEYLHSFGMVLCFSFFAFAILEGMDIRVVKYADRDDKCAFLGLCPKCDKYIEAPCGLKRFFQIMIPAAGLLALLPFCAKPLTISYDTEILGTLYTYTHSVVHQIFEIRICPLFSLPLILGALLTILPKGFKGVFTSKILFSAAAGFLGFSYFRFILLHGFQENLLWFVFWEEATELLFVALIGLTLWAFPSLSKSKVPRARNSP